MTARCQPTRVDVAHRPRTGAMVEVRPMSRPQPMYGSTNLLLDVHLGILARQLRVLGIDTRLLPRRR